MSEKIAVIGLGYVGLPVAFALAKKFEDVVGFDISHSRVSALQSNHDATGEISGEELQESSLVITDNPQELHECNFFIVTVPTPIDRDKRPDLTPLKRSCELLGTYLKPGAIVVFESTVYPGVTEEFCGPLLEEKSGLKCGEAFFLGYSPERINPGDQVHKLESITKVVAGQDSKTLDRIVKVYESIITAGLHIAPTIKVAEAAKVIENTQRDLNIALMNEIALIFDRMDIRTIDVLKAARTKWNFLPFSPGLVGGHCIGVDPYYLTLAAERTGYRPEVILAGRRVNDAMGANVARKLIKLFCSKDVQIKGAKVGILGLTFKEDVPDLRNSKVPDIITELNQYGVEPIVHDPLASHEEAYSEYGIDLVSLDEFHGLDALILAVNHKSYIDNELALLKYLKNDGILIDIKSAIDTSNITEAIVYWSL